MSKIKIPKDLERESHSLATDQCASVYLKSLRITDEETSNFESISPIKLSLAGLHHSMKIDVKLEQIILK